MFAMRAATVTLNEAFERQGLPPVEFGFGLNTGPCNVGLMGSEKRLEYSCVGDTVNIASRLQDLTKMYGVWNLVTRAVAEATPGWITAPLGEASVRGKTLTVPICTILGPRDEPLSETNETLRQALEAVAAVAPRDRAKALDKLCRLSCPGIDGVRLAAALDRPAIALDMTP